MTEAFNWQASRPSRPSFFKHARSFLHTYIHTSKWLSLCSRWNLALLLQTFNNALVDRLLNFDVAATCEHRFNDVTSERRPLMSQKLVAAGTWVGNKGLQLSWSSVAEAVWGRKGGKAMQKIIGSGVSGFREITCSLPAWWYIIRELPGRHVTGIDVTQGKESITKVEENGDVVMVMERRMLEDGREGQFVLRVRLQNVLFVDCSVVVA